MITELLFMNLVHPQLNHIGMIVPDIDQAAKENAGRFGIVGINRHFTLHAKENQKIFY